jgi:hypothetical protein
LGDGQAVAQVSKLQGGAIAAIYAIDLAGGAPSLVLKVYPESLHWKMQKEVNVCALLSAKLSAPRCRVFSLPTSRSPSSVSISSS